MQSDQAAAQQGARGKAPKPVEGDGSAKHMTDKVADAALTILWIGVGEDRRSPGSRRQRAARPRRGAAQLRRTVQAFLDAGGNPATLQNSARLGIAKLQP